MMDLSRLASMTLMETPIVKQDRGHRIRKGSDCAALVSSAFRSVDYAARAMNQSRYRAEVRSGEVVADGCPANVRMQM